MCSEQLHELTARQNHLTQSLIYNKVSNNSCNLLNTVLKVNKQDGCLSTEWLQVYQLFTLLIPWLTGSWGSRPASPGSIALHVTDPGTEQNAEFIVWLLLNAYCFCSIVKLKNHKSNLNNHL